MDGKIENAMSDFCLRVLSGKGEPQEVAILPDILAMLRESKKPPAATDGLSALRLFAQDVSASDKM